MQVNIDFSEALPLTEMHENDLFEDYYDYRGNTVFKKILNNFRIKKVLKINNPQLYGMYLLQKEELLLQKEIYFSNWDSTSTAVKEVSLYHATSVDNARSIAQNNIDWRMTTRSRFGLGACFSPNPHYADKYSSSRGAFVIFEVLIKNVEDIEISYDLEVPECLLCDTTSGNDGSVYVKYDDNTFYPKYIVYY